MPKEKMIELCCGEGELLEAGISERNLMYILVTDGGSPQQVELNRSQVAQLVSACGQAGGVID